MTSPNIHNELITNVRWQFAKTQPNNPHWYILLKWMRSPEQREKFIALAKDIFKNGRDVQWYRKTYRYLRIGDYDFWSMDPTWEQTDLINRAYWDGRPVDLSKV